MKAIKRIFIGIFAISFLAVLVGFYLLPMAFQAKYEGTIIQKRDGTGLMTFVRLPDGDGPFPTLIVRSPYELPHTPLAGMEPMDFSNISDAQLGEVGWKEVTDAGYALVIQHTRGRVGSEGRAADLTDRADGIDLLNWIQQQAWSNGKIGTCGDSIEAILAMILNAENPEGLVASYAQIGTPNLVNQSNLGPGGAVKLESVLPWLGEQAMTADANHFIAMGYGPIERRMARIKMGLKIRNILSDLDHPEHVAAWKHLPLKDYPVFSDVIRGWNSNFEANPNSHASKYFDSSNSKVPTFYVAAWYDVFAPSQLSFFEHAEKDSLNQRLLILNGTHFSPENPAIWPIKPMLPWFDFHLKGKKSALLDLPRVIFPIANEQDEWYGADTWPPHSATLNQWHLDGSGLISQSENKSPQSSSRSYKYDPDNPVPTIGGRNLMISHGPLDQQSIREGQRKDVLSYSSNPLDNSIFIAGHVYANLTISSDSPDTDFTMKLLDVSADGTATLVTEGILRARFREGLDKEVFMKPEEKYQLKLDLGHIAWRFKSGHKIGVDISSSNFPQWDRNLNTDQALFESTDRQVATNTIHHGELTASFIELPVISNIESLAKLNYKTD